MNKLRLATAALFIITLTGCGGGGGSTVAPPVQPSASTSVASDIASYTLSLQGNIPAGPASGIQFDLALPAGATLNIDNSDSSVLASSLAMSASAPSGVMLASKYSSGTVTVGIITTQGIGSGGFAILTCNVPSGTTAPDASAFAVNNLKVVDNIGNTLAGVTVTVD
jgi:hypothetical protein